MNFDQLNQLGKSVESLCTQQPKGLINQSVAFHKF